MSAGNKSKVLKKGERVPCFSCGQPIHIDRFAGVVNTPDGVAYTCDALPCLLAFEQLTNQGGSK